MSARPFADWPAPDGRTPLQREVANHLRVLHQHDNGGDAPGYLSIFTLPDRDTRFVAGDALGDAVPMITAAAERGNTYTGVCLLAQRLAKGRRGSAADVLVVPGVWMDVDVFGPNHKSGKLPCTKEEALDFLIRLDLRPTLVVDSGGGFQVLWLFRDPVMIGSARDRALAAALSDRFQRAIIARGEEHGWKLDNTSDLARVLRPAGTLNHKGGSPVPVTTFERSDARYTLSDIMQFCRTAHRAAA